MKPMYLVMVVFVGMSFGIDYFDALTTRMFLRGVLEVVAVFVLAPQMYRAVQHKTMCDLRKTWHAMHPTDRDTHE